MQNNLKTNPHQPLDTLKDIKLKLEHFCAYQERCHQEVVKKLYDLKIYGDSQNEVIVHLISNNFLNEERFALLYAISKFHQKKWGRYRIKNELSQRNIGAFLIQKALKSIPEDEYQTTFETVSEQIWNQINETSAMRKKKKFVDTLLRKGYEQDLIFEQYAHFTKSK